MQARDNQGNLGAFVKDATKKAKLDNTAPTIISIARKAGEPTGTINSDLDFVVTFSEQVNGFTAADLSADNSATIGSVSCSGVSCEGTLSLPSSNYTGTVTITVATTGFTDVADNSVMGTTKTLSVAVDTQAPTAVAITSTPPAITTANEASYALSGTCSDDNEVVEILLGGTSKGTATCGSGTSGTWSVNLNISSEADADDTVAIVARHKDAVGNYIDSTAITVVRDTEKHR